MDWNQRFAGADYLYGTEPSEFVAAQAWRIAPGASVLSLAEGEGRNAVYLAGRGARVTGLEAAPNAIAKARALARARGIAATFLEADLACYDWPEGAYDAVLGCCMQFAAPPLQGRIFAGMARATRPGGIVLIHGFATRQPAYGSGGPAAADQLYTLDLLRAAFPGWGVLHQADYDAEIHGGTAHGGRAALVDFIASRP